MEKVLCIARKDIPAQWLKEMGETALTADHFYMQMKAVELHWLDRESAEKNPAFKQIIPYVVFQSTDKSLTACYQRNGSEKRLTDLWSVGIGGHVNPVDACPGRSMLEDLVACGLNREIEEEIGKIGPAMAPDFVGVINEEQTAVGSVHIGLVHRLTVVNSSELTPSAELSRFQWIKTEKAGELNLEIWSFLALDLLNKG
jgi:predicted NUDIX family phosphoesterase